MGVYLRTTRLRTAVRKSATVAAVTQPPGELDQRAIRAELTRAAGIRRFEQRLGPQFVEGHIEAGTDIE